MEQPGFTNTDGTPRRPTVLVVDDEVILLRTLKSILEYLGYGVLATASPEEAVSLAAERAGEIDLLLTDIVMPGMNGYQVAERVDEIIPGIRVLFTTGYPGDVQPDGRFRAAPVLRKPFSLEELSQKVGEMLDAGQGG